ncbi:hypothetical protein CK203_115332 [Vitis vinifera]|uniref:Uncharacterized protein n=1 Tax=Vitis vinifera TaxID=29760 RepID=A0A438DGC2_VITVI|nr:hypothetical protein CK203_115332 [Vitis vinifera]
MTLSSQILLPVSHPSETLIYTSIAYERKNIQSYEVTGKYVTYINLNQVPEHCPSTRFWYLFVIFCPGRGFADYMVSGGESAYQQLCNEITVEFNECSKQVLEMESLFLDPDYGRDDLAHLLRSVQNQEKQKLHLVCLPTSDNSFMRSPLGRHECVHVHEITEAAGTEEAEADAEYDNALNEAIRGVQDAVTTINDHLEEIKYEIAALEAE